MIGIETRAAGEAAGVTGPVALGIYEAMSEMLGDRETRIPNRLEPMLRYALHRSGAPGGDAASRARFATISVQLEHLRAAQRARLPAEIRMRRAALQGLAALWLEETSIG